MTDALKAMTPTERRAYVLAALDKASAERPTYADLWERITLRQEPNPFGEDRAPIYRAYYVNRTDGATRPLYMAEDAPEALAKRVASLYPGVTITEETDR